MSWLAIARAVSDEMAKPMPAACAPPPGLAAARVGMPMTCPDMLTSAPPLLPGLMGALVWMTSGRVAPAASAVAGSVTDRPVADTMPSVTLLASTSGLPGQRAERDTATEQRPCQCGHRWRAP